MDIWSIGCIFAGLLFDKDYMFPAKTDENVLNLVISMLGREELDNWLKLGNLDQKLDLFERLSEDTGQQWSELVDSTNRALCGDDALDLLEKMLRFNPNDRWEAEELLKHDYFRNL